MVPQWVKLCEYSLRSLSSAQCHGAALHVPCRGEPFRFHLVPFLPAERERKGQHMAEFQSHLLIVLLEDALVATLK